VRLDHLLSKEHDRRRPWQHGRRPDRGSDERPGAVNARLVERRLFGAGTQGVGKYGSPRRVWKGDAEQHRQQAHCWVLRDRARAHLRAMTPFERPAVAGTRSVGHGTARTLRTAQWTRASYSNELMTSY
jgi:hypothetical protein